MPLTILECQSSLEQQMSAISTQLVQYTVVACSTVACSSAVYTLMQLISSVLHATVLQSEHELHDCIYCIVHNDRRRHVVVQLHTTEYCTTVY